MIDGSLNFFEFLDQNRTSLFKDNCRKYSNSESETNSSTKSVETTPTMRKSIQPDPAPVQKMERLQMSVPAPHKTVISQTMQNIFPSNYDDSSIFNPFSCISYLGYQQKSIIPSGPFYDNSNLKAFKLIIDNDQNSSDQKPGENIVFVEEESKSEMEEVILLSKKRERENKCTDEEICSENTSSTSVIPINALDTRAGSSTSTRRKKKNKVQRANELFQDSFLKNSIELQSLKVELETRNITLPLTYNNYSYEDYQNDLKKIENTHSHNFMKTHFASMYNYDNFYKFIKFRREIINQSTLLNSDIHNSEQKAESNREMDINSLKGLNNSSSLPKKIWTPICEDSFNIPELMAKIKSLSNYNPLLHTEDNLLEYIHENKHTYSNYEEILLLIESNDEKLASFLHNKYTNYISLEQMTNFGKKKKGHSPKKTLCK